MVLFRFLAPKVATRPSAHWALGSKSPFHPVSGFRSFLAHSFFPQFPTTLVLRVVPPGVRRERCGPRPVSVSRVVCFSKAAARMVWSPPPPKLCALCSLKVYPVEELNVDGALYHKACPGAREFRSRSCLCPTAAADARVPRPASVAARATRCLAWVRPCSSFAVAGARFPPRRRWLTASRPVQPSTPATGWSRRRWASRCSARRVASPAALASDRRANRNSAPA